MREFLQFGEMCHWAALVLDAYLVGRLLPWRAKFPAFFWYNVALFLSSGGMYIGHHVLTQEGYFQLYWTVTALEAGLALWVTGELWARAEWGLMVGLGAAIATLVCGNPALAFRSLGILIAATAFLSIFRESQARFEQAIGSGMVLYFCSTTVLVRLSVPLWTKYAPVFAWIGALGLWIYSTPKIIFPQQENS